MNCLINPADVEKPLKWKGILAEIGFGRGDFTVRLAKLNPNRVVVGFELSGISIEKLLKRVRKENLKNVFCVQMDAFWGFYFLLEDRSVDRIYINYPDPWFKKKHRKRRLTSRKNLLMFSKKLNRGGCILLRTDHYPFLEYTLEEAKNTGCLESSVRELSVDEPLTKYESKWLSKGKKLYEIRLTKVGEPPSTDLPSLKEVAQLFPVRIEGEPRFEHIENRELRPSDKVIVKTFKAFSRQDSYLIETLLSEEGFTQKFLIEVRRKENFWIADVSRFSQVIRTEGIQRAIELVAHALIKP